MSRFRQSHSFKRMSVSTSYLNLIAVLNPWIFGDALFALKFQKLQFSNIQKRLDILKNATCREGYMNIWRCGRDWIRSGRDLMGAPKDKPKTYLAHQFPEMDLIWNSISGAQACPFVTWPQDSNRNEKKNNNKLAPDTFSFFFNFFLYIYFFIFVSYLACCA